MTITRHMVDTAARRWALSALPAEALRTAAPILREIRPVKWRAGPGHTERLGSGWGFASWNAAEFLHLEVADVVRMVFDRLDAATAALGAELERHLRGQGVDRQYIDGMTEADAHGVGAAMNGMRAASANDVFFYLGGLPHISADDDNVVLRAPAHDGLYAVVRLYGFPGAPPAEEVKP